MILVDEKGVKIAKRSRSRKARIGKEEKMDQNVKETFRIWLKGANLGEIKEYFNLAIEELMERGIFVKTDVEFMSQAAARLIEIRDKSIRIKEGKNEIEH